MVVNKLTKCAGSTKNGLTCKLMCPGKYCRHHCKKTGGSLFKKKEITKFNPIIDFDKFPQVKFEQKKQKHNDFFAIKKNANKFCAKSEVMPGKPVSAFLENNNGIIASIDDIPLGFLLFTQKSRSNISGGKYLYLDLICTDTTSKKRKTKKGKNIPIGTLLLAKFEEIALQLGFKKIKGEAVKSAIKFYEKNGWIVKKDFENSMSKKLVS